LPLSILKHLLPIITEQYIVVFAPFYQPQIYFTVNLQITKFLFVTLFLILSISFTNNHTSSNNFVDPPFSGTIFLDPDIITESDPTAFKNATFTGMGMRTMFDRRTNSFNNVNAYLFNVFFDDGFNVEAQVNPEFGSSQSAMVEVVKYAPVIGRIPHILRKDVQTLWIHKGLNPFGGGNNNLLIHTEQGVDYINNGILEETFVHEAAHTSLDAAHAAASGWITAQNNDPTFISTYARDNPTREDIAESYLPYLAVKHRSNRISASLKNTIMQTIPNRINYFDQQNFNLYPFFGCLDSRELTGSLDQSEYRANQTITTNNTTTVNNGMNTSILAGMSVTLSPGLHFQSSSTVRVAIEDCPSALHNSTNITVNHKIENTPQTNQPMAQLSIIPNPIRNTGIIQLEIIEKAPYQLDLLDMQGRVIQKICHQSLDKGSHQFILRTNQLSSGLYYLSLQNTEAVFTEKVLIKK
jgi:hypothetical protein